MQNYGQTFLKLFSNRIGAVMAGIQICVLVAQCVSHWYTMKGQHEMKRKSQPVFIASTYSSQVTRG